MCFFCSYWGGHKRATVQGRDQEVRNVQGSLMHNDYQSLIIPSADHSKSLLKWRESEWRVSGKGKNRDLYSFPLFPCYSLSQIFILSDFPPPYQLLLVDHVCSFTVCFWSGCSWLAEVRWLCVSKERRGLAREWCGWAPGQVSGLRGWEAGLAKCDEVDGVREQPRGEPVGLRTQRRPLLPQAPKGWATARHPKLWWDPWRRSKKTKNRINNSTRQERKEGEGGGVTLISFRRSTRASETTVYHALL